MIFYQDETFIHYNVQGEGDPLLLIHGVVVDSWLFEKAAGILSNYYKVITYDRRGSMRSPCNEKASYDMDAQIEDVTHIVKEDIVVDLDISYLYYLLNLNCEICCRNSNLTLHYWYETLLEFY